MNKFCLADRILISDIYPHCDYNAILDGRVDVRRKLVSAFVIKLRQWAIASPAEQLSVIFGQLFLRVD